MDELQSNWKERWVTPKAKVHKSKIFNYALFAVKKIKKNELIRVTGGIIIPKDEINKYRKIIGYAPELQINDNFFISISNKAELKETGLFNHSCNPNTGLLDSINIIAIRDIEAGEELTIEYATWSTDLKPFKCNCGSPNCRKIIRPDDWKKKSIQRKYGRYFSPYLKRKLV